MAEGKKKKFGIWFIVSLALVLAITFVAFGTDFELYVKVIITAVLLGAYIFARRGYIYFYTACSLLQSGNPDRAWRLMKKAIKAKAGEEQRVMASSAFIQISSEPQFGIDSLEKIIAETKNEQIRHSATVTVSMGYWRLGNPQKAISILEKLREEWSDSNLYVNLATYYLESGLIEKAGNLLSEAKKKRIDTDGMLDNELWFCIVSGNWNKAEKLSALLVDEKRVKFPEAYVHAAQVALHNGNIKRALDCLGWAMGKRFSLVSTYTEDYIQCLSNGLVNPQTTSRFSALMEQNLGAVASGKTFDGFEVGKDYSGPRYVASNQDNSLRTKKGKTSSSVYYDEDDERMPNTDLDEKDGV